MEGKIFFVLYFLALMGSTKVIDAGWDYSDGANGPVKWGDNNPLCNNKKQSPIKIELCKALFDNKLGTFAFTNFDKVPKTASFKILNNGHSFAVDLSSLEASVSGGGLDGSFRAHNFHFHWGKDGEKGSEHELDGNRYAGELHIVNYHNKYENLSMAAAKPDGLAVLGILIKVGNKKDDFDNFLKCVNNVTKAGTSVDVPPIPLDKLLPKDRSEFYRYHGSLTTPPCYESVTWTVFKDVLEMSRDQLEQLRSLEESDKTTMLHNFRPVQPLNGRVVAASFQIPDVCSPAATKTQVFSGVFTEFFGVLAPASITHVEIGRLFVCLFVCVFVCLSVYLLVFWQTF